MVQLRIDDLAQLLGKSRAQVEEMLKKDDVIELDLSKRQNNKHEYEKDDLRIFE